VIIVIYCCIIIIINATIVITIDLGRMIENIDNK